MGDQSIHVLLGEDNPTDAFVVREAFADITAGLISNQWAPSFTLAAL